LSGLLPAAAGRARPTALRGMTSFRRAGFTRRRLKGWAIIRSPAGIQAARADRFRALERRAMTECPHEKWNANPFPPVRESFLAPMAGFRFRGRTAPSPSRLGLRSPLG
jgi:hypothetical protein